LTIDPVVSPDVGLHHSTRHDTMLELNRLRASPTENTQTGEVVWLRLEFNCC
jgi:hypothetical protein